MCVITGWGITAGAHRLWTHRSYKANTGVRIFLMICYSTAGQVKFKKKYIFKISNC